MQAGMAFIAENNLASFKRAQPVPRRASRTANTPDDASWFIAIIGRRPPAELMAQRLVIAPARHLDESELYRSFPDGEPVADFQRHNVLAVDNQRRRRGSSCDCHGVH